MKLNHVDIMVDLDIGPELLIQCLDPFISLLPLHQARKSMGEVQPRTRMFINEHHTLVIQTACSGYYINKMCAIHRGNGVRNKKQIYDYHCLSCRVMSSMIAGIWVIPESLASALHFLKSTNPLVSR